MFKKWNKINYRNSIYRKPQNGVVIEVYSKVGFRYKYY